MIGVETLLEAINNNMNQTNVNDISMIKTYLEQLYLEYSTQIGRPETPSTPMGPPQPWRGKWKAIWNLNRSSLGCGSSSSGSSRIVNELTMYLQMVQLKSRMMMPILTFWPGGKHVKVDLMCFPPCP